MIERWLLAALHLLAFGFALAAIRNRARALRQPIPLFDPGDILRQDMLWGLTALVLLLTGLWRAFGGVEKGAAYYLHQPFFHLKMTCLALILILEAWPMRALIKWRLARSKDPSAPLPEARQLAIISDVQLLLLLLMVLAATAMARGVTMG
ncbi:DUF2214 family protein [Silvimonas sp. JCM 19000]